MFVHVHHHRRDGAKSKVFNHLVNLYLVSRGVKPSGISGPHWKRKSCLGPHIKYTNTNKNKKKTHNVLSKFMILCWAALIAFLGLMLPTGCWLDSPGTIVLAFYYYFQVNQTRQDLSKTVNPGKLVCATSSLSIPYLLLSECFSFSFPLRIQWLA